MGGREVGLAVACVCEISTKLKLSDVTLAWCVIGLESIWMMTVSCSHIFDAGMINKNID